MNRSNLPTISAGALICLALTGCGIRDVRRPQPGDTVTPEFRPVAWTAGKPAALTVQLHVQGPKTRVSRYLKPEEVPKDTVLRATITFFDGDRPLGSDSDMTLTRDC